MKYCIAMKHLLSILLLFPYFIFCQSTDELLAKAVSYHDPNGNWSKFSAKLSFQEKRPNGDDRSTTITINNSDGYMMINRNNEEIYEVEGQEAEVLKGDRQEDRAIVLRNYYLYLWGLPMKLYDKNTPKITVSDDEKVGGIQANVLRIAYKKDTWYFYFEASSGRMIQYKFYQDAEETNGELITLEDEIEVEGIKIPQRRSWYTLPDNEYLGTDILIVAN